MSVVTVRDVLAISSVRNAGPEVLAGAAGLDTPVRWVHSAELIDIASLLREGDLLLSTAIAMPDGASELDAYATSLHEGGVAGLVIELGRRWTEVPPALVAVCEELGLPLIALHREVRFAAVAQAVGEQIVDRQVAELREAQRVHETFTELSIAEAGPDEILSAVQRLSGSTVVIESEQHQVLAYKSAGEDLSDLFATWTNRSRSIVLRDRTMWDRPTGWLLTRVGRRDRGWGRLVVLSDVPPDERLTALVERAAAALALHRVHSRQRDTAVRRLHHELVVGLLTDPSSPDLLRRCELAGVPMNGRQLVGMTVRPQLDPAQDAPGAVRTEEVVAATLSVAYEQRVPALVCEIERDVRVLLSLGQRADAIRTVSRIGDLLGRRQNVVIAVGRPVARGVDADRTLREAQHVIDSVRPADRPSGVLRLEDVHLRGLLSMLADDDRLAMFADRELAVLRDHDAIHGTQLVAALSALVSHPRSKSEAADSLHLSRAVFYDRLARVERLIGADLNDPDIRVSLHVALLVEELLLRQADRSLPGHSS